MGGSQSFSRFGLQLRGDAGLYVRFGELADDPGGVRDDPAWRWLKQESLYVPGQFRFESNPAVERSFVTRHTGTSLLTTRVLYNSLSKISIYA